MSDNTSARLISSEAHVIEPPTVFDEMPASLHDRGPKLETVDGGSAWVIEGFEPVPLVASTTTGSGWHRAADGAGSASPVSWDEVLPALHDPSERLRAQWTDSIDAEILYPTPELWDAIRMHEDPELKLGLVRTYNDWIADFSRRGTRAVLRSWQAPDH